jgi:uncharacterized protein (DUF3084 family)
MEKTAVEWLVEKYIESGVITLDNINQSLEIEKQQIIDAHGNKKKHARDTGNYEYTYTGEMYFNDNYY